MAKCIRNLSKDEIFMEFGKDDDLDKCDGCECLSYKNGTVTCDVLEKGDNENAN